MGFSIASPGLQQLQQQWARTDAKAVVREAASHVGLDYLVPRLHQAAKAAGASREMLGDIGVFSEPDGSVLVGVPPGPSGQEAHDLEYGTAVGAPHGWMRATIANQRVAVENAVHSTVLTRLKVVPR